MSGEIQIRPGAAFDEESGDWLELSRLNRLVRDMVLRLAAAGVDTLELADGSIDISKLAEGLIPEFGIGDGSISALKLADGAVTTPKLADGALSADAAGWAKMVAGYLATAHLADGILSADAAGQAKMANTFFGANAAGRAKMASGYVTAAKLAAGVAAGTFESKYGFAGSTSSTWTATTNVIDGPVVYDNVGPDPWGVMNPATGQVTIAKKGLYYVHARFSGGALDPSDLQESCQAMLFKNGASYATGPYEGPLSTVIWVQPYWYVDGTLLCNVNDVIDVRVLWTSTAGGPRALTSAMVGFLVGSI